MNQITKTLLSFGLSENEIKIYLEALKHQEISPYKLARLTGIPRTTVYDLMLTLALKKLITIKTSQGLEKQQTWIVPENPSVLRETIMKRRRELVKLEVDTVTILSDLKSSFLSHGDGPYWRYFPGKNGIKQIYSILNSLPDEAEIYFFDHMMPMDNLGKSYINAEVARSLRKGKRKKRIRTIMPLTDWTRHVLSYQYGRSRDYIRYHEYRYIDEKGFQLDHDMYICEDKVFFIVAKEDEIWAALLTSKLVARTFASLFALLWKTAQPVTEQFVKDLGENEFLKAER